MKFLKICFDSFFSILDLFVPIFFLVFFLLQLLGLFILNSVNVSGYGVFNDYGDYVYYINKSKPDIFVNITSGSKPLFVKKAILKCKDVVSDYDVSNENSWIPLFTHRLYDFKVQKDLSSCKKSHFKLFVFDENRIKEVKPAGDPIDFDILFDNSSPVLKTVVNKISSEGKLILIFNEFIYDLNISFGNQVIHYENVKNHKLSQGLEVEVDLSDYDFSNELYNVKFVFRDLAGNVGVKEESLYVHSKDLEVKLLTLRDDPNIEYNYNKDYVNFFNSTIYAKSNNFDLYVKTNKPAKCFFSSSLLEFKRFRSVYEKKEFFTTDGLLHKFPITQYDTKIWVACQNVHNSKEIVYLSDVLGFGQNLINIKVYDKGDLEVKRFEPKGLVTSNPFSIFAETNNRAICLYSLDNKDYEPLVHDENYTSFSKYDVSVSNGAHNIKLKCFDLINNIVKLSNDINVDPSLGVRVVDYSPKFTAKASVNVSITLSEFQNIVCKYYDSVASVADFDNFFEISGNGLTRSFLVSNLKEGNNSFYIYCKKDNQVTTSKIDVVYDTRGVQLVNYSFINGNFESDYLGKSDKIVLKYGLESLIPIKSLKIVISGSGLPDQNFSMNYLNPITILGDFNNYTSLLLTAVNLIDINGTMNIPLKFDFEEPNVSLIDKGDLREVVCSDQLSGCAKVSYGLSMVGIDCKTNMIYNSSPIDIRGKNFLCVEAFDYANNRFFKLYELNQFISSVNQLLNDTNESLNNISNSENDNVSEDEEFEPLPDVVSNPGKKSSPFKIVGAIFLLLLLASSGGYYAYKKGYLNEQLKKLGIAVPGSDNINSQNANSKKNNIDLSKDRFKSKDWNVGKGHTLSKSDYEKHLDKVNRFIDSKIRKTEGLFSRFDSNRGKVDKYHDTLAKKKSFHNEHSKEEFDEFYSASKISGLESTNDIEKEAESFETYLKKRKKQNDKSKKNKKK